MDKSRLLRWYVRFSVLAGFILLLGMFLYIRLYVVSDIYGTGTLGPFNGTVEKSIFNVTLSAYGAEKAIFNTMGLYILIVLVINGLALYLFRNTDEFEEKELKNVTGNNLLLAICMLFAQVLFIVLIPSSINGEIQDMFVLVKMPILSDNIRYVINFNYVLSLFYIGYNIYVLNKTAPEQAEIDYELDEELYTEEFYQENKTEDTQI